MEEIWNLRIEALQTWYRVAGRKLPWRENHDPYRVWVSEIMLQQTRVDTVIPYYARFLQALPDVFALADAPEEQLLKLWEGLGYYSRVRNMKKAAQQVAEQYAGVFPNDMEQLIRLSGFGAYTAGAVASIAYNQPTPAVDGNVLRVLARLDNDATDIALPEAKKNAEKTLRPVLQKADPRTFNQAMMDPGATVCLPNGEPLCSECPLMRYCQAFQIGNQRTLPVKSAAKAKKTVEKTVFLIQVNGKIAFRVRPNHGLLAKMWEFPNVDMPFSAAQAEEQLRSWGISPTMQKDAGAAKHIFTHITWLMNGVYAEGTAENPPSDWIWLPIDEIREKAVLPTAFRFYTNQLCGEAESEI